MTASHIPLDIVLDSVIKHSLVAEASVEVPSLALLAIEILPTITIRYGVAPIFNTVKVWGQELLLLFVPVRQ